MSLPSYWLSPSVLTITSAPSFRHASRPAWKPAARPLLFVRRTMWSTPSARATSIVRSVEPSSMISHSTTSKPSTSRGRSARTSGSVCSSSKQGIWMISFMQRVDWDPNGHRVTTRFQRQDPGRRRVAAARRGSLGATTPGRADRTRHGAHRRRRARARGGRRLPDLSDLPELRLVLLAAVGPRAAEPRPAVASRPTARRPSTRWRSPSARCWSPLGDVADRVMVGFTVLSFIVARGRHLRAREDRLHAARRRRRRRAARARASTSRSSRRAATSTSRTSRSSIWAAVIEARAPRRGIRSCSCCWRRPG